MLGVLTGFFIIGVIILAGYLFGRWLRVGPDAQFTMQSISFNVALPCLMIDLLARADLGVLVNNFTLIAFFSAIVIFGAYLLAARFFLGRRSLPDNIVGALASSYVNSGNIGLPVAMYVLGGAEYSAPVLIMQVVVMQPIALAVLDVLTGTKTSWLTIVRRPFQNPITIGALIGILLAATHASMPDWMIEPFHLIGGAAVPLVLMAFGLSLNYSSPLADRSHLGEVVLASTLKTVAMPVVAFLMGKYLFSLEGHELFVVTAVAALPTAQNVFTVSSKYRCNMTTSRDTVFVTTLAAVPVLLVVAGLLG